MFKGSQPSNASRFGVLRFTPLRVFAVTRSKRCGSNEADVRGGSFDSSNCITLVARCLNREDATPVIFDQPCRRRRGIRSRHAHEPIQPDRASPLRSSRPSSHHAPTRVFSLRGVPLREADIHGLAGRLVKRALWRVNAFLPAFLARRRSWVFLRPSQVYSRRRVSRRFRRSGPTCRFCSPRVRPD